MPTYPPNLTHSLFTICKIITFKVELKVFFLYAEGGQQSFRGLKNHFLESILIARVHNLVPNWVRCMSTKSHAHKRSGTLREKLSSTSLVVCWNLHTKAVFVNRNSIWKILDWKFEQSKHALVPLPYVNFFIFEKH
jgi:hypothetical protein